MRRGFSDMREEEKFNSAQQHVRGGGVRRGLRARSEEEEVDAASAT